LDSNLHGAALVPDDAELLKEYFRKTQSYQESEAHNARRFGWFGIAVGVTGALIGLAGVGAVVALTPLKTVVPIVFRVDRTSGAVERVYDLQGGPITTDETSVRYFLWAYVRLREGYSAQDARFNSNSVDLMSAPDVQNGYFAATRLSNPDSPQALLGNDGTATLRWISTTILDAKKKLAQVRFELIEQKRGVPLPTKRMVATITYDFASGRISSSDMNVNPLGFVVTSYRVDQEATP
jgi:type IV secretion system protein VirB8